MKSYKELKRVLKDINGNTDLYQCVLHIGTALKCAEDGHSKSMPYAPIPQSSGGFRGGALGASAPPAESMVKIS